MRTLHLPPTASLSLPQPRPAAVRRRLARVVCRGLLLGMLSGVPWLAGAQAGVAAASCQARSTARQVALVELYTSEGCNSCPPADRWLSTLRGQPGVLAVAFHVDYWDQLGWPDRFAQPAFSARQHALRASSGAGFAYTPQVLVNGRDWRGWPGLPALGAPATVTLGLARSGPGTVQLDLAPQEGAPRRLGLWWALLEDGHASAVRAGENRGETLRHDHVVRQWHDEGGVGARRQWTLAAPRSGEGGRPVRVLAVVVDLDSGRALQALQLDC